MLDPLTVNADVRSSTHDAVGWLPRSIVAQELAGVRRSSSAHWSARHAVTVKCVQSQTHDTPGQSSLASRSARPNPTSQPARDRLK